MSNSHSGRSIKEEIAVDNASVVSTVIDSKQESAQELFSGGCVPHIKPEPAEDDAEETLPDNISTEDPLALPSTVQCKEEIDVKVEQEVKMEIQENVVDAAHPTAGGADVGGADLRSDHYGYHSLGQDLLEMHMKQKHAKIGSNRKNKCDICDYLTVISRNMRRNPVAHTGERPFHCDKCCETFTEQEYLSQHIRIVHASLRPHNCGICGKAFTTAQTLTRHHLIHTGERPFLCDKCNKTFTDQQYLSQHIRVVHASLRSHSCDVCGKTFTTAQTLTRHYLTHTSDRPFPCDKCNKSFTRQTHLSQHIRAVHDGVKTYSCDVCGKAFTLLGCLTRHQLTHTDERPFSCNRCSKTFIRQDHLSTHIRSTHDGLRPHHCDVCGKTFTAAQSLTRHHSTHTSNRATRDRWLDRL